jgi:competence protein ComEA
VFDPPSRRPGAPPGALDDPPDPQFWGPPDRPPHRRRPSRPSVRLPTEARVALAAVLVVLVSATLVSYDASRQPSGAPTPPSPSSGPTVRRVIVQVAGAVTRPGVVELPVGSRVIDAVDAVGGALPAADLDRVNLAAKLRDGEQVLVTTTDPTTTTTTTPATAGAAAPSAG